MPISWKGSLQRYEGRWQREHASKADVRIIDFIDAGHPARLRMWRKRQSGYQAMEYRLVESSSAMGLLDAEARAGIRTQSDPVVRTP